VGLLLEAINPSSFRSNSFTAYDINFSRRAELILEARDMNSIVENLVLHTFTRLDRNEREALSHVPVSFRMPHHSATPLVRLNTAIYSLGPPSCNANSVCSRLVQVPFEPGLVLRGFSCFEFWWLP